MLQLEGSHGIFTLCRRDAGGFVVSAVSFNFVEMLSVLEMLAGATHEVALKNGLELPISITVRRTTL